jgi:hypothetical protein
MTPWYEAFVQKLLIPQSIICFFETLKFIPGSQKTAIRPYSEA